MQSFEPATPDRTLESLLERSLAGAAPAQPLYSVRAGFLTAFFGGVYAAALFGIWNAARARRLARDAWIGGVVALAWSVALVWAWSAIATDSFPESLQLTERPTGTLRYAGRFLALALFGAFHLRHRALLKAQEFAGVPSPNPWPIGLASVVLSIAITNAMAGIGTLLGLGHG